LVIFLFTQPKHLCHIQYELSFFVPFAYVILTYVFAGSKVNYLHR
jgi:hypothetical protein